MKRSPLFSSVLAFSLAMSMPAAFAHVGHGDEFQAEGGVNRVEVKTGTDSLMGIEVAPIESTASGPTGVLIPLSALVDDAGRQIVFVQYENFYEPVPVTTGATQGELIEVTQGLSVGEKLVTQGSLSLYAESRKTQTATTSASSPDAIAATQSDMSHAQADAQGIPHGHDAAGNRVQLGEPTRQSGGFPLGIVAAIGGGAVLSVGAIALLGRRRQDKNIVSYKKGDD